MLLSKKNIGYMVLRSKNMFFNFKSSKYCTFSPDFLILPLVRKKKVLKSFQILGAGRIDLNAKIFQNNDNFGIRR